MSKVEYGQIEVIDTSRMIAPNAGNDLYINRELLVDMQQQTRDTEVSILVGAYDRLEKTKRCVESILKYTNGVSYELILIDNGSEAETLEYFKQVPYEKKKIYRITKNLEASYIYYVLNLMDLSKFICMMHNDLIVTDGWLENLLVCMKSDPKIGMVNPVTNNVSNMQGIELDYSSYEEMQEKAKAFNKSDPRKWEDRLRLITLGTLYRKDALLTGRWPLIDSGFFHDFVDDDVTFYIRRAGYRTVLAADTWICHDHNIFKGEDKNAAQFAKSLEIGRQNFRDKYFGIDAWDDVNNYLAPYLTGRVEKPANPDTVRILGVDVCCGTPILDLKNWMRKQGCFQTELSAFTQNPMYWTDLKTICQGPVICDREEFLRDSFHGEYFDFVVVDRPINQYHEPQKMLSDLFGVCKENGVVICRLKNTNTFLEYANMLGDRSAYDREIAYNITPEVFYEVLSRMGQVHSVVAIPIAVDTSVRETLGHMLPVDQTKEAKQEQIDRLLSKEFLFFVRKNS